MIERTRSSALAGLIVLAAATIPALAALGASSGRAASSVNAASSGRAASSQRAASAGNDTAEWRWEEGSVQWLDVDFNVSAGPSESRTYQLEYGPDVSPSALPRGLTVTDNADSIQVGNVTFSKGGSPLILSASYRGEL